MEGNLGDVLTFLLIFSHYFNKNCYLWTKRNNSTVCYIWFCYDQQVLPCYFILKFLLLHINAQTLMSDIIFMEILVFKDLFGLLCVSVSVCIWLYVHMCVCMSSWCKCVLYLLSHKMHLYFTRLLVDWKLFLWCFGEQLPIFITLLRQTWWDCNRYWQRGMHDCHREWIVFLLFIIFSSSIQLWYRINFRIVKKKFLSPL